LSTEDCEQGAKRHTTDGRPRNRTREAIRRPDEHPGAGSAKRRVIFFVGWDGLLRFQAVEDANEQFALLPTKAFVAGIRYVKVDAIDVLKHKLQIARAVGRRFFVNECVELLA
jgi:hypothetical protein